MQPSCCNKDCGLLLGSACLLQIQVFSVCKRPSTPQKQAQHANICRSAERHASSLLRLLLCPACWPPDRCCQATLSGVNRHKQYRAQTAGPASPQLACLKRQPKHLLQTGMKQREMGVLRCREVQQTDVSIVRCAAAVALNSKCRSFH